MESFSSIYYFSLETFSSICFYQSTKLILIILGQENLKPEGLDEKFIFKLLSIFLSYYSFGRL